MRFSLVVVAAGLISSEALAQNPPAGTPPTNPATRGRGGGRGGRGGGRGRAITAITLSSKAFKDGGTLPTKYSQAGDELSPPLDWTGAPDSTKSFVLIVHDLNAPVGTAGDDVLHWMVWNIPATATSLPEGVPHGPGPPDGAGQVSVTGPYSRGPAARATGPAHHYVFELDALDEMLDVPAVGASPP